MKLTPQKTIGGGVPHEYRSSCRGSLWRTGVRPESPRNHAKEHDYASAYGDDYCGYPEGLFRAMEDAANKCPSVLLDCDIMEGQPCIVGTRIPVRSVLRVIEHYGSLDEVIRCYPHLTKDQVKDALYFSQVLLEPPSGIDETTTAS